MSDTEHRADLPDIEADPWTRFDMWAQRAHDHMLEAIEIERTRGDNESSVRSPTCTTTPRTSPTLSPQPQRHTTTHATATPDDLVNTARQSRGFPPAQRLRILARDTA